MFPEDLSFFDTRRKVLFKCTSCGILLSAKFDNEEDLKKIDDDLMTLECTCGSECTILRD